MEKTPSHADGRRRLSPKPSIMGSMKKRTREKIALIVFVLLVALAGAVLTSYFATGRSWSVAASFVDDTMGRMKGYTAIVYAGVVEPEEALASEGADGLVPGGEPSTDAGAEDGAAADGVAAGGAGADVGLDAAASGADAVGEDGSGASGADVGSEDGSGASTADVESGASSGSGASSADAGSSASSVDGASSAGASPDDGASSADDAADGAQDASKPGLSLAFPERRDQGDGTSPADSIGLGILSLLPRPVEQEERGVYVSDVRNLYESKDAHVLTLDASNLDRYLDPQVFYVGDKRIGVYAIEMYTSRVRVSRILSYFESCDVDTVVCLTPRVGYLSTCQGTDVVIVTSDAEGVSSGGEMRDSTLVAGSPDKGDVGVVLLTSSNVASARVVSVV